MPKKNLTARAAQAAVAIDGKRTAYYDTNVTGFLLMVYPSGEKAWQAVYRHQKTRKNRRVSIGAYHLFGVADARERARQILREAAGGADPAAQRRAERSAITFDELCREYIDWVSNGLSDRSNTQRAAVVAPRRRSWRQKERSLAGVRKEWRHMNARDVTRADVKAVVVAKAESAG